MHPQAGQFLAWVKSILPFFFKNNKVLDVGAGDINGNNRHLFENCEYHSNDVYPAPNVSIVAKTSLLPFEKETFDVIVSSECFEHDPEYELSFKKIIDMLKPGGLFFFTCASTGRAEHGTRKSCPNDSFGTIAKLQDMQDYYKNLTISDVNKAVLLSEKFIVYNSYYNSDSKDLYFVGIKNKENYNFSQLPKYISYGILETTQDI